MITPNFSITPKTLAPLKGDRRHRIRGAVGLIAGFITALSSLTAPLVLPTTAFAKSHKCHGKLGVHRVIKVSPKNAFLVGVDNHARLGLKHKELVLTFDDGPRAGITEPILKALANECVKATFFSLGRAARQYPHLLRRAAKEGHTIGTHTHTHPLLTRQKNAGVHSQISRGIASVDAALKGSGYKASNFFRYPYLGRSKRTDKIVKSYGLIGFHMNIDSWDWKKQTPDQMLNITMRRTRAEGSGVVLFHDIQEKTAIALPKFLRILRKEGYKIVHLVPGDSNFDYREDIASRATDSIEKTTDVAAALSSVPTDAFDETVLDGDAASTIVETPQAIGEIDQVKTQKTAEDVLVSTPKGIGGTPSQAEIEALSDLPQPSLEKSSTLAAITPSKTDDPSLARLPASSNETGTQTASLPAVTPAKTDAIVEALEPQETGSQAQLPRAAPHPKRRPRLARIKPKAPLDIGLRGTYRPTAETEIVDGSIITQSSGELTNEGFDVTASDALINDPSQKKKKKRRFLRLPKFFTKTSER